MGIFAETRKVKVKITETFEKVVECIVPADLKSDDDIIVWLEENEDNEVLDATCTVGVTDPADEMDYKRIIEVVNNNELKQEDK